MKKLIITLLFLSAFTINAQTYYPVNNNGGYSSHKGIKMLTTPTITGATKGLVLDNTGRVSLQTFGADLTASHNRGYYSAIDDYPTIIGVTTYIVGDYFIIANGTDANTNLGNGVISLKGGDVIEYTTTGWVKLVNNNQSGGGSSATNISYVPSTRNVVSSTGTGFVFPLADSSNDGLLSSAEKSKIEQIGDGVFTIKNTANSFVGRIYADALTANRNLDTPDKSGTIALTSDIPTALSQLTDDLNVVHRDTNETISDTKNFLDNTLFSSGLSLDQDAYSKLSFTYTGGYNFSREGVRYFNINNGNSSFGTAADYLKFDYSAVTGNKTVTWRDLGGTPAFLSDLSSYVPLTGASISSPITGTSHYTGGSLFQTEDVNNYSSLSMSASSMSLFSSSNTNDAYSGISTDAATNKVVVFSNDTAGNAGAGLEGEKDFSANVVSNSFVQAAWVTPRLDLKANLESPTFTGAVGGITAAMVGAPSGSGSSTGTNTGDNAVNSLYSGLISNATHTGDVTGATALTIANNVVSNAKLSQMAANTFKANNTGATANATDITAAQAKTLLAITSSDVSGLGTLATQSGTFTSIPQANITNLTTDLATNSTNDRNRANHTGTQLASTISDFSTAAVAALPQALSTTSSPTFATVNGSKFNVGTLGYSDTGVLGSFQSSVNGYNQLVIQNTNAGSSASSNLIVANDQTTSTTHYGEFGKNSSGFTGTGSFNQPNNVYFTSTSADLAIGTTTANPLHFVVNNGATDAMTISSTGVVTAPSFATSKSSYTDAVIPSAPASGLEVFAKAISGRVTLQTKGATNTNMPLQNSLSETNLTMWTPTTATGGTWLNTAGTGAGTYSTLLPTDTNLFTSIGKKGSWANVVTTTNQVLGQRNNENIFFRGSGVSGAGGFKMFARGGMTVWTNGGRFFCGMATANTVISANPSALANTVGFATDDTDAGVINFITRDATTTTKVSTGFTWASNNGYDFYIYCAPGSSQYTWEIRSLQTGASVTGTATATLPVNNTKLSTNFLASNAALTTATAVQVSLAKLTVETDY
jgi:hypothetical protein